MKFVFFFFFFLYSPLSPLPPPPSFGLMQRIVIGQEGKDSRVGRIEKGKIFLKKLTRLRQGEDALRFGSILVDLLVMRDTGLERLRLISLHPVHIHQFGNRRDSWQGSTRHVWSLFQAQLVQNLFLDGFEAESSDLLVHSTSVTGITSIGQISNTNPLDARNVEGTEEN